MWEAINKHKHLLLAWYVAVGVAMFGYAAAHYDCAEDQHAMDCSFDSSAVGLASGAFWPLYLSWSMFDNERSDKLRACMAVLRWRYGQERGFSQ